MKTIQLNQDERGVPAPPFELPSNRSGLVSSAFYRSRSNLVLYFANPARLEKELRVIHDFVARKDDYWFQVAQVVIIWPTSPESLPEEECSTFTILADEAERVRQIYADLLPKEAGDGSMIFVLDRYASPYAAIIGEDLEGEKVQDEVLGWLDFISLQCPE